MVDPGNAEQAEYWNQQAGHKWVELQSFLDDQLRDLGEAAMDRLGAIAGATVLDVGCGCGTTTLSLARRVGPSGSATGVDLSAPMLERARAVASQAGVTNVAFHQADAQSHRFTERFDAVYSRFGVMFFADPPAAFANLRGAMKPGGTVSFVCWRGLQDNEWMLVPLGAAFQHLPPPEMPAPGAPGPFAFADGERVRGILDAAGFSAVDIEPTDPLLRIGRGRPLDDIVHMLMQLGPAGRLLRDASADLQSRVAESIGAALRPYASDDGIAMRGAAWLVRAQR